MTKIRRVTSPEVVEPQPGTWSNCLVAGNTVYIAGLTARGAGGEAVGGDDEAQARVIFTKIKALVEAAGGQMSDLVKITIYVTDIRDRPAMNKVYQAWIDPKNPATRACVEVNLAGDTRIEIVVTAAK